MVTTFALFGLFATAPVSAGETASTGGHGGPVIPVLLGLVVILAAAKLGGEIFERMGQPAVLGELLFGRLSVAVGMVPRGEVGLIFAGIGAQLLLHGQPVIVPKVFTAVVVMATTLITPPALKLTLARGDRRRSGSRPPEEPAGRATEK
jgi:Kef-type K+ transport system membrane component KefB